MIVYDLESLTRNIDSQIIFPNIWKISKWLVSNKEDVFIESEQKWGVNSILMPLTAQKLKSSIEDFFSKSYQIFSLVTLTNEILNGKLHFLCSVLPLVYNLYFVFSHIICNFLNFQLLAKTLNFTFIEVAWREQPSWLRYCNQMKAEGSRLTPH